MRRAAALAGLLAAALAAPPVAPAHAADRLARAAAALERAPLFVHPDLLWLVKADERTAIERTLRGARVPVRVAVLPVIAEDESGGDARRVLFGLQEQLDRPGVLVVVDENGWFEVESFDVERDIDLPFDLTVLDFEAPRMIAQRLAQLVAIVDRAPPGEALTPVPPSDSVEGSGGDDGLGLLEVLFAGALLGGLAHVVVRFVVGFVAAIRGGLGA